ncbi:MAG: hypothetical protein FJ102_04775 [Deltaproteobacteria bacterium]|nr:hypothetical protein [Deltaproteobacteria bacterium]
MCCFSQPVASVSGTEIFARHLGDGWQAIAYSMTVVTEASVAMILPLPVVVGAAEADLEFISLGGYRTFFEDLAKLDRPPMKSLPRARNGTGLAPLAVQEIGDFVGSFVPTQADFVRLDPRFRIAPEVWAGLPAYADFGFAVFQLKHGGKAHPMAFRFRTRSVDRLFFPTVHIHDGQVQELAPFDHTLYFQEPGVPMAGERRFLDRGQEPASTAVDVGRAAGLVDGALPVHRILLSGRRKNEDVLLDSSPVPEVAPAPAVASPAPREEPEPSWLKAAVAWLPLPVGLAVGGVAWAMWRRIRRAGGG